MLVGKALPVADLVLARESEGSAVAESAEDGVPMLCNPEGVEGGEKVGAGEIL